MGENVGCGSRIRTYEYQSQNLMPYRLAIPQKKKYTMPPASRGPRSLSHDGLIATPPMADIYCYGKHGVLKGVPRTYQLHLKQYE